MEDQQQSTRHSSVTVTVTEELVSRLTDEWSDPVRVRIDAETGELVFRSMRHPQLGDVVEPLDKIWLDT